MKPSSEKRLQQLHPALVAAVRAIVADLSDQGISIEVVQGLRTFEEQDALYALGRTKPGQIVTQARGGESNHNYGLAADLCPFTGGQPDWSAPIGVWSDIGAAAQAHGLEWGGGWKKFLDKPHVQLPVMTIVDCASCYQAGGLVAVWDATSKRIGWTGNPGAPATPAPGKAIARLRRAAPKRARKKAARKKVVRRSHRRRRD